MVAITERMSIKIHMYMAEEIPDMDVEVNTSDTIGNLKNRISEKTGISSEKLNFLRNLFNVSDTKTLADCNIKENSTITCSQKDEFPISIRTFTGGNISLLVKADDKVEEVRGRVLEKLRVSDNKYVLLDNGNPLIDGTTLGTYFLVGGATLFLREIKEKSAQKSPLQANPGFYRRFT